MLRVFGQIWRGVQSGREHATGALRRARERWAWFAHLARAYERYREQRGDRLAAGLTYFGFLSFFPLLALAYSLLGYLVGVSEWARETLVEAVESVLPGLATRLPVEQIANAKTAAGVIGLLGLLYTGLGSIGALRESLREIWRNDPMGGGNYFVKLLGDIGVLLYLGTMMLMSVVVSTVATSATHGVLDLLHLAHVPGMGTLVRALSLGIAIAFDTLVFLMLLSRLSGTRAPWRRVLRGALFGAVGLEILKLTATVLVGHAVRNPVYGPFAVMVGLLIWINVVSRFTIFTAAWTATRRVILSADAANPDRLIPASSAEPRPDPAPDTPAPARTHTHAEQKEEEAAAG